MDIWINLLHRWSQSCHVALCDRRTVRRHFDHIRLHSSFAIPDGSSGSDDMVKVNTLALGTIDPPPLPC